MKGTFHSLSFFNKIKVFNLWIQLIFIDLRLKFISSKHNKKWLYNNKKYNESNQVNKEELDRFLSNLKIASSHSYFFNMSCLRKSILIRKFLNKNKVYAKLVFGLAKDNNKNYIAHSWIEVGNFKIDPSNNYEYYSSF